MIVLFTPDNLKLLLNLSLVFIVLIVFLAGIVSMWRKVIPHMGNLIFMFLLFGVGIFVARPLGDLISTIDISSLGSITINEQTIAFTTVSQTIEALLRALAGNDQTSIIYLALNNQDLNELIMTMTTIIIRYLAFFVYALVVLLFGGLLWLLLYHCGIKFFFPKKLRQYKNRLISFFIGLTNGILAVSMLLMPFTAIANTVNQGVRKNPSSQIVDQESYDQIFGWLDAYDSSVFAKVLFFAQDKDGRSLDVMIMDYATRTSYQGEELIFSDQIGTLANLAEKLIAAGAFAGEGGFDSSVLLSKDMVNAFVNMIIESGFLLSLMPILFNIALTYGEDQDFFDASLIDLENMSWSEELEHLNEIYGYLYDSGIITDLQEGHNISLPMNMELMHQAFAKMDESVLMQKLLPAVLYTLATRTPEGEGEENPLSNFLSTNWDDYQNIAWGSEIKIFYDTLYQLKEIDIDLLGAIQDSSEEEPAEELSYFPRGFIPLGFGLSAADENPGENPDENEASSTDTIVNLLLSNFEDVAPILTGYKADGTAIENPTYLTIFDSSLLSRNMSKLLRGVADSFLEGQGMDIDQEDLNKGLEELKTPADYKLETFSLLKVASALNNNPDLDFSQGLDLEKASVRETLIDLAPSFDDSAILSNILPGIFESNLQDFSFGEGLNLTGADLNFHDITFADEIPLLMNGYEDIMAISEAMSATDVQGKINALDPDQLASALDMIYLSKIINPVKTVDGQSVHNDNFYRILDVIFDNDDFKEMGIYKNKKVNYAAVSQWTGPNGENRAIANLFLTLKNEDLVSIFTSSTSATMNDFTGEQIRSLFASVDQSVLIRSTFGAVLDHVLAEAIDTEIGVSFDNVTNWTEEGEVLANVIESFKTLDKSISNIDWLNSDPDLVEPLLREFAKSQIFEASSGDNVFGVYLWKQLKSVDDIAQRLKNYPSDEATPTCTMARSDFETISDWSGDDGEIVHIINVIRALQSLSDPSSSQPGSDGLSSLGNGNLTSEILRPILEAIGDAPSFRMIAINAIDENLQGSAFASIGDVNIQDANIASLLDMTASERKAELLRFADLYEALEDLGVTNTSSTIDSFDPVLVDSLLRDTYQSQVFNTMINPATRTATVFEQLIAYLCKEANLGESISGSSEPLEQKEAIEQLVLTIPNSVADADVEAQDDGWIDPDTGEITRIVTVIRYYDNLQIDTFDGDTFLNMEKASMVNLFQAINHSTVMHPAIPDFFKQAVETMGVQSFLQGSPDYQLILSKPNGQFYSSSERIVQYDLEIELLASLLEETKIQTTDGSTGNVTTRAFDFNNDSFSDFVKAESEGGYGKSTTAFFSFLHGSQIMKPVRSEMILQVFERVGHQTYVRPYGDEATLKAGKLATIETLFSATDFNPTIEGKESLDRLIIDLESSLMALDGFDSLLDHSELISGFVRRSTFVDTEGLYGPVNTTYRAYFTSEVVSGFLTKNLDYYSATTGKTYNLPWSDNNFALLNRHEADGLEAMLNVKKSYNTLLENPEETNVAAFRASMNRLDTEFADSQSVDVLSQALFYDTVCEQSFTYYGVSITLNQVFETAEADTFTKQADLVIQYVDYLPR